MSRPDIGTIPTPAVSKARLSIPGPMLFAAPMTAPPTDLDVSCPPAPAGEVGAAEIPARPAAVPGTLVALRRTLGKEERQEVRRKLCRAEAAGEARMERSLGVPRRLGLSRIDHVGDQRGSAVRPVITPTTSMHLTIVHFDP